MSEPFWECSTAQNYGDVLISEFPTPVDGKNGDFNGLWVPTSQTANGQDILVKKYGSNEWLCYNDARFVIVGDMDDCEEDDDISKANALAYAKKGGDDVENIGEWVYKVNGKDSKTKNPELRECNEDSIVDMGGQPYKLCGKGLYIYNFAANSKYGGYYSDNGSDRNGYTVTVKHKTNGLSGNVEMCYNGKLWMITDDWKEYCDADDNTVKANALWYAAEKKPEDIEEWTSPSGQKSEGYVYVCPSFKDAAKFELDDNGNTGTDNGMPMAGIIVLILMAVVVIISGVVGVVYVRKKAGMAKIEAGVGDVSDDDEENNVERNNEETQKDEEKLVEHTETVEAN